MKKILVLLLIVIICISCDQKREHITLDEIAKESRPVILVEKRIYDHVRGGYSIYFKVRVENDTLNLWAGTFEKEMKIWNTYEPGDTIKFREEFEK